MSKAQTTEQLIEEAVSRLEEKLKPLYKSGSFDVFNLKVAIEKELSTIASKSAEASKNEWFDRGYKQGRLSEIYKEKMKTNSNFLDESLKKVAEALSKGTK